MIPFLHLGPLQIPTFGLMVATAMVMAYFVLRADLARRAIAAKDSGVAEALIAIPCLAGIIGAKLYHVLETPRQLLADPIGEIFSRYGLAWFGGLIAGFAAFIWLARRRKIPLLTMLDVGSPAAALGYGIGRIGCFLSGDGDYGQPTNLPWGMRFPHGLVPTTQTCVAWGWPASCKVQPTPLYEFVAACAIAWLLWRLGGRQITARIANARATENSGSPKKSSKANRKPQAAVRDQTATVALRETVTDLASAAESGPRRWRALFTSPLPGAVFAAYLFLTGLERFLVEFIRINPRSFFGIMSNAQTAGLASLIVGIALWFWLAKTKPAPLAVPKLP
ncbi:MAG TPA: prolipoprotein diacylglyceryl transferase [Candidatus Dormibacteraeota bacterium]|nr:prolipoprotein diacylglyceryl transferase [Candidatus Dormibacteraeota bacterium]